MKFFWRAKKDESGSVPAAQTAATPSGVTNAANDSPAIASDAAETPRASASVDVSGGATMNLASAQSAPSSGPLLAQSALAMDVASSDEPSNVVTLQPARLSERIAQAALKTMSNLQPAMMSDDETVTPRPLSPLPGQEEACAHLARVLAGGKPQAHVVVVGPSGSGRRTAVRLEIERQRQRRPRPSDWIYVGPWGDGRKLKAFAMPPGQGALLAHEAKAAIARARANFARLTASDEYRLGLEIIDEEFRHRSSKTLEGLKRRAEDQNIALVKTPEGFVLAPMHEGKVVRNDVFRALPQTLQRDVEAKIAGLEGELKAFIDSLPAEDTHQAERIAAFNRDAAARAIKPHLEPIRLAFDGCGDFLDTLQIALIDTAPSFARAANGSGGAFDGVQVLCVQAASDFAQEAPAVFAHDVSPSGLCGQLAMGAGGELVMTPGALSEANGGFLVIEAWRLLADPKAWAALSEVLDTGELRPRQRDGFRMEADPVPFQARVVILADEDGLAKLQALDPGARRLFPYAVRFPATLPRRDIGVETYASVAATLAEQHGLRPIALTAADALYRAALVRAEYASDITFDGHALAALLFDADLEAAAHGAAFIRASDVEAAARRAGTGVRT